MAAFGWGVFGQPFDGDDFDEGLDGTRKPSES